MVFISLYLLDEEFPQKTRTMGIHGKILSPLIIIIPNVFRIIKSGYENGAVNIFFLRFTKLCCRKLETKSPSIFIDRPQ